MDVFYTYFISFQNGTKKLNIKRVQELYADFYLGTDPSSPSRYIAGPIDYEEEEVVAVPQ